MKKEEDVTGIAIIDKLFFDANINRYGIMAILLLVVGSLSGIAVGLGAINSLFQLFLLAFTTMFSMSMMLAIAPMKWVIWSGLLAIVIDVILIIYNLL